MIVRSKAKHFPLQSELRWLHLGVRSLEPAAWLLFSLFQPSSLLNPCHGRGFQAGFLSRCQPGCVS